MESFPNRSSSKGKRILIFTSITITILAFIIIVTPHSSLFPFPKNLPMPVCSIERRIERTFSKHLEYFDLSPASNDNWTSLMPTNGGFIVQKTPEGGYAMAGITMFHQLHCLQMIRSAFQELEMGNPISRRDGGVSDAMHPEQNHWVHCLDYLMQGILCAADDTIEPAHEVERGRVVDGYGVNHICRDPDRLWYSVMGKDTKPGWTRPQ